MKKHIPEPSFTVYSTLLDSEVAKVDEKSWRLGFRRALEYANDYTNDKQLEIDVRAPRRFAVVNSDYLIVKSDDGRQTRIKLADLRAVRIDAKDATKLIIGCDNYGTIRKFKTPEAAVQARAEVKELLKQAVKRL